MSSFDYSHDRFLHALCILRGERGLPASLATPRYRLHLALLCVYPCTPHHFARGKDYVRFARLMARIRDRSPKWRFSDALPRMSAEECAAAAGELAAIAEAALQHFRLLPNQDDDAEPGTASEGRTG